MDVAQIYMLALRPTMVPIAGESWSAMPFYGQVELEGWSWDLVNAEEKVDADMARDEHSTNSSNLEKDRSDAISKQFADMRKDVDTRADRRDLERLRGERDSLRQGLTARQQRGESIDLTKDFRDIDKTDELIAGLEKSILERTDTARVKAEKSKSKAERDSETTKKKESDAVDRAERIAQLKSKNYEFTFRKRVDISTTQLLNCLKAGDKLPTVTLTMHQASSNTPWILIFTLTGVRLKDYKVRVESSDTMSDMKEDWTAEFEHFGYVYQNRPHAGIKSMTAGHVNTQIARAATQMTVRTFAMMPRRSVLGF